MVVFLVRLFEIKLQKAIGGNRGLKHDYRRAQRSCDSVRGRILFTEQLRKRPRLWSPIEVEFDEFTSDTEQNRVLKAALDRVLKITRSLDNPILLKTTAQLRRLRPVSYTHLTLPTICSV